MTEWGIPVTGMHPGLCTMSWDQCHWMKHIMDIFNCDCVVHPSNWAYRLCPQINVTGWCTYWTSPTNCQWTKCILHIFNLFFAVHHNYWDALSNIINHLLIWRAPHQCHWMKHMLHNRVCFIHPSKCGYQLCIEINVTGRSTLWTSLCLCSTSQ